MDKFDVMQGTALPLLVNLVDAQGNAQVDLAGDELLTGVVWPGGNRAASFAIDVAWSDPAAGLISLEVGDDQTGALAPGRYQGNVLLDHPTLGLITAYRFAMEVLQAAGPFPEEPDPDAEPAPPPPPVYAGLADLLKGRKWLRELQDDDEPGGFAGYLSDASRWLDDLVIERAPRSFAGTNLGDPGFGSLGAWGGSGPSPYLRELLDGGGLVVRDWVREAVAMRAAYLVCNGQLGPGTEINQFQALARRLKAESYNLATSRNAELRTAGPDSPTSLKIHLGSGSVR